MKDRTAYSLMLFASAVAAGGGAAMVVCFDYRPLKALGAYLAVLNSLYAILWIVSLLSLTIQENGTGK